MERKEGTVYKELCIQSFIRLVGLSSFYSRFSMPEVCILRMKSSHRKKKVIEKGSQPHQRSTSAQDTVTKIDTQGWRSFQRMCF